MRILSQRILIDITGVREKYEQQSHNIHISYDSSIQLSAA